MSRGDARDIMIEVCGIKRSGPGMESCGTPKRMWQPLDVLVPTRTECVLPARNETINPIER